MKRSKEEILSLLNDNAEGLGDALIGLLEDISDSMTDAPEVNLDDYVAKSDYDALVADRDELKAKYIARFMGGDDGKVIEKEKIEEKIEPEQVEAALEDILKEYE